MGLLFALGQLTQGLCRPLGEAFLLQHTNEICPVPAGFLAITQTQSRVENTKDQIKRVLALLKKMREDVDVQIADEKEKQEQLAVETEL